MASESEFQLSRLDLQLLKEQQKIYFIDMHGEPTLLTPAQMVILKTIAEDYEEDLKRLREIPIDLFHFLLKIVEAEHNCNKKVAKKLGIQPSTVYTQLVKAKYKLGYKSTLQLLLNYSMTVKEMELLAQRRNK